MSKMGKAGARQANSSANTEVSENDPLGIPEVAIERMLSERV